MELIFLSLSFQAESHVLLCMHSRRRRVGPPLILRPQVVCTLLPLTSNCQQIHCKRPLIRY